MPLERLEISEFLTLERQEDNGVMVTFNGSDSDTDTLTQEPRKQIYAWIHANNATQKQQALLMDYLLGPGGLPSTTSNRIQLAMMMQHVTYNQIVEDLSPDAGFTNQDAAINEVLALVNGSTLAPDRATTLQPLFNAWASNVLGVSVD